jgi:DNA-directed RNA polymerase specialized sigma24 family protein
VTAGTPDVLRSGGGLPLAELVNEHYGAMHRFARLVRRDGDPRAAVREAWVRGLEEPDSRPEGTSMRGWLLMLVLATPAPEPHGEPAPAARPEDLEDPDGRWAGWWKDEQAATPAAEAAALEELLAALPPLVAEIAVLRDVEGLPAGEVEAISGQPADRQLQLLQVARAALRNGLRADGAS